MMSDVVADQNQQAAGEMNDVHKPCAGGLVWDEIWTRGEDPVFGGWESRTASPPYRVVQARGPTGIIWRVWQEQRLIAARHDSAAAKTAAQDHYQRALVRLDLVRRLRKHVRSRGGPKIENGAWAMMLDAADQIERLAQELEDAGL